MSFKRNLIYFVCPFKSNNEWRLNIRELMKYWDIFNGKKIVTVARGDELACLQTVKKEFKDYRSVKFLTVSNDRELGEVKPFKNMLELVQSLDPCEFTFYAHAKGVSPKYQNRTNRHFMKTIRIWRNSMYHYCLRDSNQINRVLSDFSCCGCFKNTACVGLGHPSSKWHFAGTYFWFNNKQLFRLDDWEKVEGDRWAVEGYLGCKLPESEAYSLFAHDPDRRGGLMWMGEEQWNSILPDFLTAKDFEYGYNRI